MSKSAILILCLVILAVGCKTSRQQAGSRPPDWDDSEGELAVVAPMPSATTTNISAPISIPVPAKQPVIEPVRTEATWISLNRWATQHGMATAQFVSPSPASTWALRTSKGTLVVREKTLSAWWNGVEFRLGFEPQLINNQIFLHALDLLKNIEPLTRPFVLSAAGRSIVIDPGHGGSNAGTRSVAGGWEKEFTLDWALRLAPLLEKNGWRVWLTRSNDMDVSLADRVALAESVNADLFVSLHFNSSGGRSEASGLETYCLTPAGMTSSLTRGFEDDSRQIFPNNAFDAGNLQLAMQLHRALLRESAIADRGVRRARFQTVLRGQNRPAVLLEGGFLSNPTEARRIADAAFRQKLAEAVASALDLSAFVQTNPVVSAESPADGDGSNQSGASTNSNSSREIIVTQPPAKFPSPHDQ